MTSEYRVFVEEGAIDFLVQFEPEVVSELQAFIHSLAVDPFQVGDFPEIDSVGRTSYCKIVSDLAVSFLPDHAAKEIKVFEISLTDV